MSTNELNKKNNLLILITITTIVVLAAFLLAAIYGLKTNAELKINSTPEISIGLWSLKVGNTNFVLSTPAIVTIVFLVISLIFCVVLEILNKKTKQFKLNLLFCAFGIMLLVAMLCLSSKPNIHTIMKALDHVNNGGTDTIPYGWIIQEKVNFTTLTSSLGYQIGGYIVIGLSVISIIPFLFGLYVMFGNSSKQQIVQSTQTSQTNVIESASSNAN